MAPERDRAGPWRRAVRKRTVPTRFSSDLSSEAGRGVAVPPSPVELVDPTVLSLCREILERGLVADVRVGFICGEPDVRLVVRQSGDDPTVELLSRLATDPVPAHWAAVRVRVNHREVWQGPQYGSARAEVVSFVAALLTPRPEQAPVPCTLLG
jgi:hypothetical protein